MLYEYGKRYVVIDICDVVILTCMQHARYVKLAGPCDFLQSLPCRVT